MSSASDPLDQAFPDAGSPDAPLVGDPIDAAFKTDRGGKTYDEPYNPSFAHSVEDTLNQVRGAGSSLLHSVVGGYKGLYTLGTTGDSSKAADAVNAETAKTYRPPTMAPNPKVDPGLQAVIDRGSTLAPPTALGDIAANHGAPPWLSTALATAPTALASTVAAPRSMSGASPSAEEAVSQATARQSGGAASASPNLVGISPELRGAIAKAGPQLDTNTLSRHLEADSLPVPVKLTAGQATQDPVALSTEQNARAKFPQLAQRYTEQNQALIDNLDEIRRSTAPDAVGNDPVQNGQALLDKYKAYDAPIKQQVSANYKALADANGGDLPVDGVSFADAADAALKKNMKAPFLPSGVRSIIDDVKDGGPMSFENFENLRTTLSAEARKADRSGDGNAAAAVNLTRNALEQLPMTGATANVKALADTARQSAAARFSAIEADPAYKAAVNDDAPIGEQSPLADDFVKKYVIGGKKANLDLMKQKFAGDSEATGTIQASALNYLKSKAGVDPYTNTGNFSQAGYNKARAELEPRMDSLLDPDTADKVRTLGNVARYTQAQPRGSFVNNSNTFTAAAGEHAKGMAEGAVNYLSHGVPVGTWARKAIQGKADAATVNRALEPGAGLSGP